MTVGLAGVDGAADTQGAAGDVVVRLTPVVPLVLPAERRLMFIQPHCAGASCTPRSFCAQVGDVTSIQRHCLGTSRALVVPHVLPAGEMRYTMSSKLHCAGITCAPYF